MAKDLAYIQALSRMERWEENQIILYHQAQRDIDARYGPIITALLRNVAALIGAGGGR